MPGLKESEGLYVYMKDDNSRWAQASVHPASEWLGFNLCEPRPTEELVKATVAHIVKTGIKKPAASFLFNTSNLPSCLEGDFTSLK